MYQEKKDDENEGAKGKIQIKLSESRTMLSAIWLATSSVKSRTYDPTPRDVLREYSAKQRATSITNPHSSCEQADQDRGFGGRRKKRDE